MLKKYRIIDRRTAMSDILADIDFYRVGMYTDCKA